MRGRQVTKEGKSLLNKLLRIFPNQNTTWKVSIPAMLTSQSCTAREGIPTMSVGIIWYALRLQPPHHKPCKRPTAVLTSHVLRAGALWNAWLHCYHLHRIHASRSKICVSMSPSHDWLIHINVTQSTTQSYKVVYVLWFALANIIYYKAQFSYDKAICTYIVTTL